MRQITQHLWLNARKLCKNFADKEQRTAVLTNYIKINIYQSPTINRNKQLIMFSNYIKDYRNKIVTNIKNKLNK